MWKENNEKLDQLQLCREWRACFHQLLKKDEQLNHGELDLHQELQQKEAEVKDAKRGLSEVQGKLQALQHDHEESLRLTSDLEIER